MKTILLLSILLGFTQNSTADSASTTITYCVPDCNVLTTTEATGSGAGNPAIYYYEILIPEKSINEIALLKGQTKTIKFLIYNNSPETKIIQPKFSYNTAELILLLPEMQSYRFEPQEKKEINYQIQFPSDTKSVKTEIKISFSDGYTTKNFLFKIQEKKIVLGQTILGLNQTDFLTLLALIILIVIAYWKKAEILEIIGIKA